MGMYTELHFNASLLRSVPKEVINVLQYMIDGDILESIETPDHPLFEADRWGIMLRCDSYYFDADTHSTLRFDEIHNGYYLCIRSNLKNYDGEIEKFIDWIHPYLDAFDGDFLGFYRYEEDEIPTLIFKNRTVKLTENQIAVAHTEWQRDEASEESLYEGERNEP
jgi:hypothetical protein